uniref:Thioredoxin domain-containing protein n=1 Tax=Timema cristinae TaxID=61476 RepID=A0A7R9CF19_TIMCR|nr:unnamed protein product [Timema cristinae]
MISEKPSNELWLVNYFAPWCYSCKALTPEWRHLAKMARDLPNVYIGEVNCEKESIVCMGQGIRAYPSIRLYPFDSKGVSTFAIYSGYTKTARSLFHWLFNFLPSPVLELNPSTFNDHVMMDKDVWLVDFYAPWCGHCVEFAPVFHVIAQMLLEEQTILVHAPSPSNLMPSTPPGG